jgi:drug/metabolite transporter (DMT)-like permease
LTAARQPRQLLAFAALAATMLFWSGNLIVGRAMRDEIPAFMLAFMRWVIAFIIILPFAARHVVADRQKLIAGWKSVLFLGVVGVGSFNAFLYYGLHFTTATNASLLEAAIPAFVLLFNLMIFGQRATANQVLGVLISAAGVVVIICHGHLETLLGLGFGVGDMLILGAVLAWAIYTSMLRLKPDCHPLSFLAVTFGLAALTMAPFAATEMDAIRAMHWGPDVIGAMLYVGIIPSIIAYGLFNFAVEEVGAVRAGQANNLLPLFGAFLAVLLLSEPFHGYHVIGIVLILAGIALGWEVRKTA